MSIEHYYNTNYTPLCIEQLYHELQNPNWWVSPFGVTRSDLSKDLVAQLQSRLPFEITDAGFLKRDPVSFYEPHVDPNRTFALNILLSDPDPKANAYVMIHDKGLTKTRTEKIEYVKDKVLVLNTKKVHYIVNHSEQERIILSIGCNSISYIDFVSKLPKDCYAI